MASYVNPDSAAMTNVSTVSEFSTYSCRVQLRKGTYKGSVWLWIRVIVRRASNYMIGYPASEVKLTTPVGNSTGLNYGNSNNLTVGAKSWTAAINIGNPASLTTVTFKGAAAGDSGSKTVRV